MKTLIPPHIVRAAFSKRRSGIVTSPSEQNSDRRIAILESAAKLFLRYGYKKTSMNDLANAAELSRQGLYLHFKTKEEIFKASIMNVMEVARTAYREALEQKSLDIFDRLLNAFEAFHGCTIGQLDEQYVGEILETATSLLGDMPTEHENQFIADVTKQLSDTRKSRPKNGSMISPREVAETLCATSFGIKHRVATPSEYRKRMAIALRIALARDRV